MSRYLSFASLCFLFLIVSCAKEASFEQGRLSRGSLQSSTGDCLPKTVSGDYKSGQALTDSNYIDVSVDVAQTGRYTISTDTVNGYYFKGTGNFGSTGVANVRLKGFGTPTAAGTDDFMVFYDSSFCVVSVAVTSGGGSSGGTAEFVLQGNGGSCMTANITGSFTEGVALTAANKIDIQVNVTKVGSWNVSTTTVDGFSFSGSGNFTAPGVQNITLIASGTPTAAGNQTFPVTAGSSTCSFVINVVQGSSTPSTDHFILTDNSWWSYSTPLPGDSLKRNILGSFSASGVIYKGMKQLNVAGPFDDTLLFRKSGNLYYELNYIDYYTSFYFDNTIVDSILFLKEGLTTGDTWSSAVYTGTENGATRKVRYDFKCDNANATVTLNARTYTNVYQVTLKVMVDEGSGFNTDITWTNYYAQGIGWIYQKYDDGSGSTYELPIRYYRVL